MKQKIIENIKCCSSYDNEDRPVLEFINGLSPSYNYNYIEIGSGLCRFPIKLKKTSNNINISCYEINKESAQIAQSNGFATFIGNVLDNGLPDESYDIVHCSHIIEHFKYPDVIFFINEMLRITKKGGYLIIRSPLMWEHFFDDIDHIRPYPPESIMNYLYNPQQQQVGTNKVKIEKVWYRTRPLHYSYMNENNPIHNILLFREIYNRWIHFWNNRLINSWNRYRWPSTKPNGYVLILKKEK